MFWASQSFETGRLIHRNEFYPEIISRHISKLPRDEWLQKDQRKYLVAKYNNLFPEMKKEKRTRPNQADFDLMCEKLDIVSKPVKDHRDTVVAHKDEKPKPATFRDIERQLKTIERFLFDFYMVHSFVHYTTDFGGNASDIPESAKEYSELILLNSDQRELKAKGSKYR